MANLENKLGLNSAKLSRTKFGWCGVIFEFVLKQFTVKKIFCSKKFGQNFLSPKNFGSKNILGQKQFWSEKIKAPKKLGQNWVRNNWAIHDMEKSCQDKYC